MEFRNINSLQDAFRAFKTSSWESIVHVAVLGGILGFILFNRIRNYSSVIRPDGTVTFPSADGWYHRRATIYTVKNYPETLKFDPYSGFDVGNRVGQFGTLFDQLLATVALIVGRGDPSTTTIDLVLAFTPPVLAVIAAIAVYYLGEAISNRWGGLISVAVLALTPGLFLSHSMVGFIDHHIAETVLVAISLSFCVTFGQTVTDRGISLDDLRTRPYSSPLVWSFLVGVVNGVYLLIWPPGLLYIAILSVFLAATIIVEYLKEARPVSFAIGGAVMMITPSLMVFPFISTSALSVTALSLVQAIMPAAVGVGCLGLGFAVQKAGTTKRQKVFFVSALFAVTCTGVFALTTVKPDVVKFFIHNSSRVFWFMGGEGGVEIAEASALANPFQFGFITYGFALFAAIAGWLVMAGEVFTQKSGTGHRILLCVFGLFMASATITQPRFDYYLVIAIAVFSAYSIYTLYTSIRGILASRDFNAVDLNSKVVVTGITILVLTPLVASGAPIVAADSYSAPSSHNGWEQSFDWIESETPAFGAYGVDSPNRVNYTGSFEMTSDYTYKAGQYGILSRWGVGHRLTVETQRVPVSNPHQQHTGVVADVLLAPTEEAAVSTLDSKLDEGSGVQYVVLGRPWGSGSLRSFTSPAASEDAYGINERDLGIVLENSTDGEFARILQSERSYESLRARLYQFHGSAAPPSRYVIHTTDGGNVSSGGPVETDEISVEQYDTAEAATDASKNNSSNLHGGLYGEPPERINALQHFRLVHASEGVVAEHPDSLVSKQSNVESTQTSAVKSFERVPGASIRGTGPENTTVKASAKLRITTTGDTFRYTQYAATGEDGVFQLVVPYATTGYSEYTPVDGFTNTSVRAEGPYQITVVGSDTAGGVEIAVPEGVVLGEEPFDTRVRLESS